MATSDPSITTNSSMTPSMRQSSVMRRGSVLRQISPRRSTPTLPIGCSNHTKSGTETPMSLSVTCWKIPISQVNLTRHHIYISMLQVTAIGVTLCLVISPGVTVFVSCFTMFFQIAHKTSRIRYFLMIQATKGSCICPSSSEAIKPLSL